MQLAILTNYVDNSYLNYQIGKCIQEVTPMIPVQIFSIQTENPVFFQGIPIQYIGGFDGLIIATSKETAQIVKPSDKTFQFVWNMGEETNHQLITRNEVMQEELGLRGKESVIGGEFNPAFIKKLWRSFITDRYSVMSWE